MLFDDIAGGRLAAEHLINRGYTRIMHVCSTGNWSGQRYEGMQEAAAQHNDVELWRCPMPDLTPEYLNSIQRPYAIIAVNDHVAPEIMYRVENAGLRIPFDVAMVSFDNDPLYCEATSVPLSSMRINATERGRVAAECLHKLMDGIEIPPEPIHIQPDRVVVRASTDIYAVSHPPTNRALQYIREHLADDDLSIDAIAAHSGIGRRVLEQSFAEHIHQSIANVVTRFRVDRAIELIRQDSLPMAEIASACGFSSHQAMCRSFNRLVERKPTSYRPKDKAAED